MILEVIAVDAAEKFGFADRHDAVLSKKLHHGEDESSKKAHSHEEAQDEVATKSSPPERFNIEKSNELGENHPVDVHPLDEKNRRTHDFEDQVMTTKRFWHKNEKRDDPLHTEDDNIQTAPLLIKVVDEKGRFFRKIGVPDQHEL